MLAWTAKQKRDIARVVDPGAGSGRYTLAALRQYPAATAVAVECDPTVSVLLRANLAAAGFTKRVNVLVSDFRQISLPTISGTTLYLGNPPYVRHHGISVEWKEWYSDSLAKLGHKGSQLAGLHLHFFLKTLELAKPGDVGCYVTAAEWLDVNYGSALRHMLTNGLGGTDIFAVDPALKAFDDALVSAVVTCFAPGSERAALSFKRVSTLADLENLNNGNRVNVEQARAEPKWSFFVRGARPPRPKGHIELGEIFRVSRGQVTGLNRVWVAGSHTPSLPSNYLVPAITGAADITSLQTHVISSLKDLRRVVTLPADLSCVAESDELAIRRFLAWARTQGAHATYTARHRNPWWSVRFGEPAPIVMTYMGRRPPVFAVNEAGAQLINVAHGLYPAQPLSSTQLRNVVHWLNKNVLQEAGRMYAGGLTKFEPSEAMRIYVPEALAA